MDFPNFSFLISNVNQIFINLKLCCLTRLIVKGIWKTNNYSTCFSTSFNRDLFKIFEIIELLNMGTMNNKNYICVRHHVKNICNLEIDQAMELNIKL